MEVELSNSESASRSKNDSIHTYHTHSEAPIPKTPVRASVAFSFLTDKKRHPQDGPLPAIPSFSPDGSFRPDDSILSSSELPISHDTPLYRSKSSRPPLDRDERAGPFVNRAKSHCGLASEGPRGNLALDATSLLRGPRPLPKSVLSYNNTPNYAETLNRPVSIGLRQVEDQFTYIPLRMPQHRKTSSTLSSASILTRSNEGGYPYTVKPKEKESRRFGKENETSDSRMSSLKLS
jgi:hypothetical protein